MKRIDKNLWFSQEIYLLREQANNFFDIYKIDDSNRSFYEQKKSRFIIFDFQ